MKTKDGMMAQGIALIIGGALYFVSGILIYFKGRENKFDKGLIWIAFAISHGIDEIADGANTYFNVQGQMHLFLEKVEVTTFILAGTFLLTGFSAKVLKRNPRDVLQVSGIITAPLVLLVFLAGESLIDAIKGAGVSFSGIFISYFTMIYGTFATISFAVIIIMQVFTVQSKWKYLSDPIKRKVFFVVFEGFMLLIYTASEILVPLNELFVIPEVLAIFVVLIAPQEIMLSENDKIQLYMAYEDTGLPIVTVKLNTTIPNDLLDLVTGFLSAINVMASSELEMGNLDQISTEQGYILSEKRDNILFAMLVDEVNTQIKETFENINSQVYEIINSKQYNAGAIDMDIVSEMEEKIFEHIVPS